MTADELQKRLKSFACRMIPLCDAIPAKKISKIIQDQLLRSAFSAAANYRSACMAQSDKAFKSKISIAFEEMDESLLRLVAIDDLSLIKAELPAPETKEAGALSRISAATRISPEKKAALPTLNLKY